MNKVMKYLGLLLFVLSVNCITRTAIDVAPFFRGQIIDIRDNTPIEGAKIIVTDIDAVGHNDIEKYKQFEYYSDTDGYFILNLPGGVEWEESNFSQGKKYTKYIRNVTVTISKESFHDGTVIFFNANYERSYVDMTISIIPD